MCTVDYNRNIRDFAKDLLIEPTTYMYLEKMKESSPYLYASLPWKSF